MSDVSLEGVDFTFNFANPLFKGMLGKHVSISDNLDLANSVAIKGEGGAVRVMAGSAGNLTDGAAGISSGSTATVASFLLDINDAAFIDGLGDLNTAGIQITANLDQTVFSDLSTLRDRGGSDGFSIGSEDISVVMAESELDDVTAVETKMGQQHESGFVLGTVRELGVDSGVDDFSNLIRRGATLYSGSSTWTNSGDITATDVELTLNNDPDKLAEGSIELTINKEIVNTNNLTKLKMSDIAMEASVDIDYAVKALGEVGSIFESADIGYKIGSAGEKEFSSTPDYTSTKNLLTYQADLNLDGAVSMLDLAYLNSGAIDETKDSDTDFDGTVDMNDLELLDEQWGDSMHSENQTFLGSNDISWDDLSSQGGASWNDNSFQDQNNIENGDDYQVLLDLNTQGSQDALDIESDYFQDNDLAEADPI